MSDEQFLARWSRRKQEAKADTPEVLREEVAEPHVSPPSDSAASEPVASETDLSKLPPIASIDAATDVSAFLRKGVPHEMSRAALRRAWSADPAIRDFVGLAENAWDFNDPNAMPGFGPLNYSAEQVEALVQRIVGNVAQAADNIPVSPPATAEDPVPSASVQAHPEQASEQAIAAPQPLEVSGTATLPANSAASQPAAVGEEIPVPRRKHGGALPR